MPSGWLQGAIQPVWRRSGSNRPMFERQTGQGAQLGGIFGQIVAQFGFDGFRQGRGRACLAPREGAANAIAHVTADKACNSAPQI